MKSNHRWALAGVLLLSLLGCGNSPSPVAPDIALEVHVASWFMGEYVNITLDGRRVYDGVVTTEPLLGVAAVFNATAAPGLHRVDVSLGGLYDHAEFDLQEPTYVIIFHDAPDQTLQLVVTRQRPLWD